MTDGAQTMGERIERPADGRPRVMVISHLYEPASGGGTAIDARGAASSAAQEADVWVVADDRDIDGTPLNVTVGKWTDRSTPGVSGAIAVQHRRWRGLRSINGLRRTVAEVRPDVVLTFSTWAPSSLACLLLHRIGALGSDHPPLIVAPAGELFEGALSQSRRKKQLLLFVGRAIGLWKGIIWRASDDDETATIKAMFPRAEVRLAPVMPAPKLPGPDRSVGGPGPVRLVSVGTVGVKKGLTYLLDRVGDAARAGMDIELDVYGAELDPDYAERCRARISALPERARVVLHGRVDPEAVGAALARSDAFALATQGENFGLAILEALDAGCPVLVSDRTPWRHLVEEGSGWDLPLEEPDRWVSAIREISEADDGERLRWSTAAMARAERVRRQAVTEGEDAWRSLLGLDGSASDSVSDAPRPSIEA